MSTWELALLDALREEFTLTIEHGVYYIFADHHCIGSYTNCMLNTIEEGGAPSMVISFSDPDGIGKIIRSLQKLAAEQRSAEWASTRNQC